MGGRKGGSAMTWMAVRRRHDKIHAEECAECQTREGKIDRIEREIELAGEKAVAELKDRTVEIANQAAGRILSRSLKPQDHQEAVGGFVQEAERELFGKRG